jgi:hypothetical protein
LARAAQTLAQAASLPEGQAGQVISDFVAQYAGDMAPADMQLLEVQLNAAVSALQVNVLSQEETGAATEIFGKLQDIFAKLETNAAENGLQARHAAGKLGEKLEEMSRSIARAAVSGKEIMHASVDRAIGQSRAMEQIDQFVYAQIPLEMNGRKNMAELYVFKRPGKAKADIDIENVTMMVALDTRNMGHVESLVKVEMKNVFLRFRVEDDGVSERLEENAPMVKEALQEIGYHLVNLKCEMGEGEANILNAAARAQAEFLDVRNFDLKI